MVDRKELITQPNAKRRALFDALCSVTVITLQSVRGESRGSRDRTIWKKEGRRDFIAQTTPFEEYSVSEF
jgi:hypothetical protein